MLGVIDKSISLPWFGKYPIVFYTDVTTTKLTPNHTATNSSVCKTQVKASSMWSNQSSGEESWTPSHQLPFSRDYQMS